jgi:predicted dehydrogenase
MGRLHAGHAAAEPACRIGLFVDTDLRRAEALAARFGGEAATDHRRALDDPQIHGVILTVPDPLHAALALEALAAGKHVMMEKPIAVTLADADAVVAAAGRAERVVFVAHVLRFRPALRRIKRLLAEGALGEPIFARYHHEHFPDLRERAWLTAAEEGGIFVSGAVHHADVLRWWLGEVAAVTGHGRRVRPEYRAVGQFDHALIVYDFASGALGESTYSYASHQSHVRPSVEATVTGTEGDLVQFADGAAHVYRPAGRALGLDLPPVLSLPPLGGNGLAMEVPHFVRCILGTTTPAVTPRDARRALEIVLAARRSAEEGRTIPVQAMASEGLP